MIIAALLLLLGSAPTAPTAASPPATSTAAPPAADASVGQGIERWTSTRTRAEVRAEAIEAARAPHGTDPR